MFCFDCEPCQIRPQTNTRKVAYSYENSSIKNYLIKNYLTEMHNKSNKHHFFIEIYPKATNFLMISNNLGLLAKILPIYLTRSIYTKKKTFIKNLFQSIFSRLCHINPSIIATIETTQEMNAEIRNQCYYIVPLINKNPKTKFYDGVYLNKNLDFLKTKEIDCVIVNFLEEDDDLIEKYLKICIEKFKNIIVIFKPDFKVNNLVKIFNENLKNCEQIKDFGIFFEVYYKSNNAKFIVMYYGEMGLPLNTQIQFISEILNTKKETLKKKLIPDIVEIIGMQKIVEILAKNISETNTEYLPYIFQPLSKINLFNLFILDVFLNTKLNPEILYEFDEKIYYLIAQEKIKKIQNERDSTVNISNTDNNSKDYPSIFILQNSTPILSPRVSSPCTRKCSDNQEIVCSNYSFEEINYSENENNEIKSGLLNNLILPVIKEEKKKIKRFNSKSLIHQN